MYGVNLTERLLVDRHQTLRQPFVHSKAEEHLEATLDALQSLHCFCGHAQLPQQPAAAIWRAVKHAQQCHILQCESCRWIRTRSADSTNTSRQPCVE